MNLNSQIEIMDRNNLNKHLDDEDKTNNEVLSDDDIIEKGFEELSDAELLDVLLDFAEKIYSNGTTQERGLLARYMREVI